MVFNCGRDAHGNVSIQCCYRTRQFISPRPTTRLRDYTWSIHWWKASFYAELARLSLLTKGECFHLPDFELSSVAKSFCFAESLSKSPSRNINRRPRNVNERPRLRLVLMASDGALAIRRSCLLCYLHQLLGPGSHRRRCRHKTTESSYLPLRPVSERKVLSHHDRASGYFMCD